MRHSLRKPVPARASFAALCLGMCAIALPAAAEPVHVLIRQPLDAPAPAGYAAQLGSWRSADGAFEATLLQGQADSAKPGFASLAILDFPDETAYARWNRTEAPKLDKSLVVHRADVLAHSETGSRRPETAVFIINQYEALVSRDAAQDYTDQYTIPKLSGQTTAGILKRYTNYLEREPEGTNPQIVLVMEYADQAAFDRKEQVKAPHKKLLQENFPVWKRVAENKASVRIDRNETKATLQPLP